MPLCGWPLFEDGQGTAPDSPTIDDDDRSREVQRRSPRHYAAGVPQGLRGAQAIRVPPAEAHLYRAPSRRTSPSARNTTLWVALLTPAEPTEIADRLARVDGPVCAVRRPDARFDGQATSLTRYIRREFVTPCSQWATTTP
jgi:hypothetical protein